MADGLVEALELQISDNAKVTARNLNRLARAVEKVGGLDASSFAKLNNSLNTVQNRLDDILATVNGVKSALRGMGTIKVNTSGMERATKAMNPKNFTGFQMVGESVTRTAQEIMGVTTRALSIVQPQVTALSTMLRDSLGNLFDGTATSPVVQLRALSDILNGCRSFIEMFNTKLADSGFYLQSVSEKAFVLGQVIQQTFGSGVGNKMYEQLIGGYLPSGNDTFGQVSNGLTVVGEKATIAMELIDGVYQAVYRVRSIMPFDQNYEQPFFYPQPRSMRTAYSSNDVNQYTEASTQAMNVESTTRQITNNAMDAANAFSAMTGPLTAVASSATNAANATYTLRNASTMASEPTATIRSDMSDSAASAGATATAMCDVANNAREACDESRSLASSIQTAVSSATRGFSNFFSMAVRMLKRNIIRQIFAGFTEGVKNLYAWSTKLGDGGAFKNIMDGYSTALNTMKNAIGSASGALLTSLYPALVTVCNAIVTAINYLNQFISALGGSTTWNKPNEVATAFNDAADSASNASKSAKELLADWDELNVITSQSGSGGGTGTNISVDTSTLFTVDQISDNIQNITDWIMEWKDLIIGAGLGLLAWKFSSPFLGTLAALAGFVSSGVGIGLILNGIETAADAGEFTGDSLRDIILGSIATGIGATLISGSILLGIAVLVGSVFIGLTAAGIAIARKNARDLFAEGTANGISAKEILTIAQASLDSVVEKNKLIINAYADLTADMEAFDNAKQKVIDLNNAIFGDNAEGGKTNAQKLNELKTAWQEFDSALSTAQVSADNTIFAGINNIISSEYDDLVKWGIKYQNQYKVIAGEMTQDQADLATRRDLLLGKLMNGTATQAETEEYMNISRASTMTESQLLAEMAFGNYNQRTFKGVDFSDGGLDEALQFLSEYNGIIDQMMDSENTSVEAFNEAINAKKAAVQQQLIAGQITQEIADQRIAFFDELANAYLTYAGNNTESYKQMATDMYKDILLNAFESMDLSNDKQSFYNNVIDPLLTSMFENPDELAAWQNFLGYITKEMISGEPFDSEYAQWIKDFDVESSPFMHIYNEAEKFFAGGSSFYGDYYINDINVESDVEDLLIDQIAKDNGWTINPDGSYTITPVRVSIPVELQFSNDEDYSLFGLSNSTEGNWVKNSTPWTSGGIGGKVPGKSYGGHTHGSAPTESGGAQDKVIRIAGGGVIETYLRQIANNTAEDKSPDVYVTVDGNQVRHTLRRHRRVTGG